MVLDALSQIIIITDVYSGASGPIIRINPHEIHINDPEYIDELFAGASKKRDKYRWFGRMLASKSTSARFPFTVVISLIRKACGILLVPCPRILFERRTDYIEAGLH